MATPFVGEIRMVGFNFEPVGWAYCNGSYLPISQNSTLFNLIGTTYGGNGVSTFALPDLQGRVPIHQGSGQASTFVIGQEGGQETVQLSSPQLPAHSHAFMATQSAATSNSPAGNMPATTTQLFYGTGPIVPFAAGSLGIAGGSQSHDNFMPFLGINFVISLFGVFPSQS